MKICFTGGGTGGHIFPALAVDEALSRALGSTGEPYERFWIGSTRADERVWVTSAGIRHVSIRSGKLRRYFSLRLMPDLFGVAFGFFQSLVILRRERPDVLFSKGGYVSVPPTYAARLLRIRCVTHESDAIPGLATLLNARVSQRVCIPFQDAVASYPDKYKQKLITTGVPTRMSRERADAARARIRYSLSFERPLVVVLGGSQGALQLNNLVWENLDTLLSFSEVVHQTGKRTYRMIDRTGYHGIPFIESGLDDLLAAATMVVSRSGATALADFMKMRVPMLLIPLGTDASRGDQLANAKRLESHGGAVVLQGKIDNSAFTEAVRNLVCRAIVRKQLVLNADALRIGDADDRVARVILGT